MMTTLQILFWLSLFLVFYTHLGYGILLYMLVKLKELFVKPVRRQLPPDKRLPDVTLFITAFNEEEVVDEKMRNCLGWTTRRTSCTSCGPPMEATTLPTSDWKTGRRPPSTSNPCGKEKRPP